MFDVDYYEFPSGEKPVETFQMDLSKRRAKRLRVRLRLPGNTKPTMRGDRRNERLQKTFG